METTGLNGQGNGKGHTPTPTLIGVILDRSGSMAACREATIAGFNEFVRDQQKDIEGGRTLVSLVQFDNRYEVNFIGEPIENVPDLDTTSYVPRGSTALHDAIGKTIHEMEQWVNQHRWEDRVLVLVITDGQENASKEYTLHAVRALLERKEKDGWNVAYMGANQDSHAVASSMGVRGDYTHDFVANADGTQEQFKVMSRSTSAYRRQPGRGVAAAGFFDSGKAAPKDESGRLRPRH